MIFILFYYIALFNFFIFTYFVFACSVDICSSRTDWLNSLIILSTQCNFINFFSEQIIFLLLNFCCNSNINLMSFKNSLWFFFRVLTSMIFFLSSLFLFKPNLPLDKTLVVFKYKFLFYYTLFCALFMSLLSNICFYMNYNYLYSCLHNFVFSLYLDFTYLYQSSYIAVLLI